MLRLSILPYRRWEQRFFKRISTIRHPTHDGLLMGAVMAFIIGINCVIGSTFALGGLYAFIVCATAWLCGISLALPLGLIAMTATALINGAGGPYGGAGAPIDSAADWVSLLLRGLSLLAAASLLSRVRSQYTIVSQQAYRDPLTGLHNHSAFGDHLDVALARAERTGTAVALVYLDLDDFKAINDRMGHIAGDNMLRIFADAARECVRKTDCIGRLGGDEFAIAIEARNCDEAMMVVGRTYDQLKASFMKGAQPLSFSAGAIIHAPATELSGSWLIHEADRLMYRSKGKAKGTMTIAGFEQEPADGQMSRRAVAI
jgi:diguanylate cyclase (GGDEF)-like protein